MQEMNNQIIMFIKKMNSLSISKCCVVINDFFHHLNEFSPFYKYSDLIRRDLNTPVFLFGKYFKENGGIQSAIDRVLFYIDLSTTSRNLEKRCIFSIKIHNVLYYCYIALSTGCECSSCGMGFYENNKMYIATSVELLLSHSIPFCELVKMFN